MIRLIKHAASGEIESHEDDVPESIVRAEMPAFFRTSHGKRETVAFYKGFLIVRNTRTYSDGSTERATQLYIYWPSKQDVLYIDRPGNSVRSAKRRADEILKLGVIA